MSDFVAVALEGPGPFVLGLTAHERNRRVLERAGIAVVDARRTPPSKRVLTIPASVVITPALVPYLRNGAAPGRLAPGDARLPPGAAYDVSTRAARSDTTRTLLLSTAKPTDGWVARHVNRRLSRPISRLLLALRMTPNHASALSLLTGLGAAAFALHPSWGALVAAALLFQWASIVDGVDGEMARLTLTESPRGASVDTAVDVGTYIVCCIAFAVGWGRQGIADWELRLAGLVTLALLVAIGQGWAFVRGHAPDHSYVFIDRCVDHVAREQGGFGFRALRVAFLFMRRDAFSLTFLVLALTGERVVYFFGLGAFVLLAQLTLVFGRERLAAAAAAIVSRGAPASPGGPPKPCPAAPPVRIVHQALQPAPVVAEASRKAFTRLDLDSQL